MKKQTIIKNTMTKLPISDAKSLDMVCQLMAISGAGGNETEVMDFLAKHLAKAEGPPLKFDKAHKKSELGGDIGNAILKLPGRGALSRSPRRLFVAHTDTVPICVGSKPVRRGKRVESADAKTGLGADDRSGTAVLLTTLLGLLQTDLPHPPLTFLWVVQEEGGINGSRHVSVPMLGKPKLAFNFDGGSPSEVTLGATGGYRLEVTIKGIPSHAGMAPEKGVSAIGIASLAVADLIENGWHGKIEKKTAGGSLKLGTSNIGVFEGGVATNVVADSTRLHIEARSHDPKFRARIVREIEAAFQRAAKKLKSSEGRRGEVSFDGSLNYESFLLSEKEPSVVMAKEAILACGGKLTQRIANGGLDANWITAHGIPTVTIGCGQHHIHTVEEQLDIEEYQFARRVAWKLATGT